MRPNNAASAFHGRRTFHGRRKWWNAPAAPPVPPWPHAAARWPKAAPPTWPAANLAGGTHHAHADFGSGFCVFNDAAIAALAMRAEGRAERVAIVDCDVHQGDGTAAILGGQPDVFTLSLHGARNFPFRKTRSDLDIELDDATGDADYLAALETGLAVVFDRFAPDLVIYLAGADPYRDDRFGRLGLSFDGLAERDRRVLARCIDSRIPVALAMAGGYARNVADTVRIHATTVTIAAHLSNRPA